MKFFNIFILVTFFLTITVSLAQAGLLDSIGTATIAVGEGVKNTGQLLQNAGKVEESVQNIVLSQTGKKDKH